MADEAPRLFRWQALFQRADDAVFVLDRRRRVLFVNRAWEALTGLSADRGRGLVCRRPRPVGPDAPAEDLVAHLLTPPPEVLTGQFARARRLFHDRTGRANPPAAPVWWDVEFLPLRQGAEDEGFLVLGRILPLAAEPGAPAPDRLPERLVSLRQRVACRYTFDLVASRHSAMRRLERQIRLAVECRSPVLFVGEPGTGKQTLARLVHYQGHAAERAFAALDCERLPTRLVAAVLMAESGSPLLGGVGTIYLRQPACLPRDLQLRLDERMSDDSPGSPRFLAGITASPEELVRAGTLLEDLAVILESFQIDVPPLRQRPDDLPLLAERMLRRIVSGRPIAGLSPAAWEVLRHHTWPGNLAELFTVLADSVARSTGQRIEVGDLPAAVRLPQRLEREAPPPPTVLPLPQLLEQVERRLIELALRRARGNRSRTAELLGIHRARLLRRLEALGLAGADETTDSSDQTPPTS